MDLAIFARRTLGDKTLTLIRCPRLSEDILQPIAHVWLCDHRLSSRVTEYF